MELVIISAIVAFLSVPIGYYYFDKGKLTAFSIFLIAFIFGGLALWEQLGQMNAEIDNKQRDVDLLNQVIKSKDQIINQFKGQTEQLIISPEPFYRGNEICYRFKIEIGSDDQLNDISIRYFPPNKIDATKKNGINTDKTFDLYKIAEIGNLPSNGWQYFGAPISIKKGEEIYYRFHVNTRNGMYWYTLIGKREKDPFITVARKLFKLKYHMTDTITDRRILDNIGKFESDTFLYHKKAFFPIDSFIPKEFPINLENENFFWKYEPELNTTTNKL